MKTLVTDGGACIEVTSQEHSESDDQEDDENVYNIKVCIYNHTNNIKTTK